MIQVDYKQFFHIFLKKQKEQILADSYSANSRRKRGKS